MLHTFGSQLDGFGNGGVSTVSTHRDAFDVVAAEFLLSSQGVCAHFGGQAFASGFDGALPALVHHAHHALVAHTVGVDDVLGGVAVGLDQVGGDGGEGVVHGDFLVIERELKNLAMK